MIYESSDHMLRVYSLVLKSPCIRDIPLLFSEKRKSDRSSSFRTFSSFCTSGASLLSHIYINYPLLFPSFYLLNKKGMSEEEYYEEGEEEYYEGEEDNIDLEGTHADRQRSGEWQPGEKR